NATAAPRSWLNALTRKRARLGMPNEKSHSSISSYVFRCASLMMSYTMACTSSCSIGGRLMRRMSPWTRISGGSPDDRCRSEALFLTANARSSVMSMGQARVGTSRTVSRHAVSIGSAADGRTLVEATFGAGIRPDATFPVFADVFIDGVSSHGLESVYKRTVVCNTHAMG